MFQLEAGHLVPNEVERRGAGGGRRTGRKLCRGVVPWLTCIRSVRRGVTKRLKKAGFYRPPQRPIMYLMFGQTCGHSREFFELPHFP